MFCSQCGQQNTPGSAFCATCGGPLAAGPGVHQPHMMPQSTSGLAIAGFVLSFFCGLLGLILSAIAKSEIAKSNGRLGGDGLATAGIVISIISLVFGLIYAIGAS